MSNGIIRLGPVSRSFYHGWVPKSNRTHDEFVKEVLGVGRSFPGAGIHHESVAKFAEALSDDQKELFEQALRQVKKYYAKWGDKDAIVNTFEDFLDLLDGIVRSAPRLYKANVNGVTIGEPVGVPIYLILDLISNTSAAYTLFTQETFNQALRCLLDDWGKWLTTEASGYTLATEWFSEEGLAILESGLGGKKFNEVFQIDEPTDRRYTSWDSFFARKLLDTIPPQRPIIPPKEGSGVFFIYSPCESTIFRTSYDIQCNDTFWLKTQNYSLYDILGGDLEGSLARYAKTLKGGTSVQAFLSPADYHRWHVPIKGRVIHKVFPGTYYAVLPDEGAPLYDPDLEPGDPHGAIIRSQPWLSVAATRAVFIIEPEANSPIELAALIEIGMVEVSTCEVTYYDHTSSAFDCQAPYGGNLDPVDLDVGKELGYFRFGGSTYLLIVKPRDGYKVVWQDIYNTPIRPGQHRWVNSVVGQVWKKGDEVVDPDPCE